MNIKPKVLLIDDEPDILEIVGQLLNRSGFEVTTASNGEEALKKLESSTYDIAVSDYFMPKMDGVELLKKVRERGDYTAFIFFSGHADDSLELKTAGLGSYGLVPKTEVLHLADFLHRTIKREMELREIRLDKTQESKDFLKLLHSS